MQLITYNP